MLLRSFDVFGVGAVVEQFNVKAGVGKLRRNARAHDACACRRPALFLLITIATLLMVIVSVLPYW